MLPRHARFVLSRLRCNGHSLLLSFYLFRIGKIKSLSCSACGHLSQDTSHLILHSPATDSLRYSLFGNFLSLYNLWSRPRGVARLLGLDGLPPCPLLRKGLGNQQQQHVLKTRGAFFTTYLLRQILFNKTREDTVIVTREHKFLSGHQGGLCVEEFTCDSALPVQEKKRVHTRCKTETTKHIKSSAPLLANSSAASFPSRIGCPGIHCSLIVQEKKKESSCQMCQRF